MPVPTTDFGPGDLALARDPYALLAALRARGRVLRGPGSWVVLGHAEALAVLRSSAARSGFIADLYRRSLPAGAARDEMSHRINFLDPPDHTRVRKLVAKAFTPRRVAALRPYLTQLCRELLAPHDGDAEIDLIAAFAHPVPSLVISELLGVPPADRQLLTALSDRVSALLGLAGLDPTKRGDVTIPPGEPITLLLASANRDPAAYPDADCFEPRRWLVDPPPPAPLSFAFGPHYCLGASLAKLEAETMLETLLASRPEIALADEALAWRHTGLFRGLWALPVRLGRPAARPRTLS